MYFIDSFIVYLMKNIIARNICWICTGVYTTKLSGILYKHQQNELTVNCTKNER